MMSGLLSRFRWNRSAIPYLALLGLYLVIIVVSPGYRQTTQMGSLLQLVAILGTVAIGQTLVILVAGIDLSVGATVTLSNMLAAMILDGQDSRLPLAIVVSLGVGALIGVINGFVITRLGVPDLVATLASMSIVTGAGYLITHGSPLGSSSPILSNLMTHRFAGVLTGGFLIWVVLAVVAIVMLGRTLGGRQVYAIGLNREASHYAGIPVARTVTGLYAMSGLTAAAAGLMLTGYLGSSYLGSGSSYQMATIAAVVLGGTSIFGGRGSYLGTMAGVGITVLLISILQVIGIPQAGQTIVYGVVILLMLIIFTPRVRET